MFVEDTIVAQATPSGRGGVAIIRFSGPLVSHIIQTFLHITLQPRQATYCTFYDKNKDSLDQGIAIYYQAPFSFTGEDVLELQGHGGPAIVETIIQAGIEAGARLARPGEFTERAFLNNKIDLAQAEAIADLIDAASKRAARSALQTLQGKFSDKINELVEKIIYLRTYVEAAIDFADEEIEFLESAAINDLFKITFQLLEHILKNAKQGSLLREGVTVVIVGEPNVGKSSLLNQLSGKESAIVTPIAGTTRDIIREHILIDGLPLHIIDTAGIRHSDDVVEQEGIKRALNEVSKADLILRIYDASQPVLAMTQDLNLSIHCPKIIIYNKSDLNTSLSIEKNPEHTTLLISAKTGEGIEALKAEVKKAVGFMNDGEGLFSARTRHIDALNRAKQHLHEAELQLNNRHTELFAEDLRQAQLALNEITGEFTSDDLLGKIFSSFCIGK